MLDGYLLGIKMALREYPGVKQLLEHRPVYVEEKMIPQPPPGVVIINDVDISAVQKAVREWREKARKPKPLDSVMVFTLWQGHFDFQEIAHHLDTDVDTVFLYWQIEATKRGFLTKP